MDFVSASEFETDLPWRRVNDESDHSGSLAKSLSELQKWKQIVNYSVLYPAIVVRKPRVTDPDVIAQGSEGLCTNGHISECPLVMLTGGCCFELCLP